MLSLTFFIDYAPLLSRSAFLLYTLLDKFQTDSGIASISYEELNEHYGLASTTVSAAFTELEQLGLIERTSSDKKFEAGSYKISALKPLDIEKRTKAFSEAKLAVETKFRNKYTNIIIEPAFQKLFDKDAMRIAREELGPDKFGITKQLAKYFGLDYNTFRLYLDNEDFKRRLVSVRREIEQVVLASDSKDPKKKSAQVSKKEQYNQLINEVHLSKKDKNPIPISEWKSPQLLRYFCLAYEKKYKVPYSFTTVIFGGREMKNIQRILKSLDDSAIRVTKYLDWAFLKKADQLQGVSTEILAHARLINEFVRLEANHTAGVQLHRNAPIDEAFVNWVKKEAPTVVNDYGCSKYEDLYYLKEMTNNNIATDEVKKVVLHAESAGLLPKVGNIKFAK